MKYAFIEAEKAGPWSVKRLCAAVGVSRSSFYEWRGRKTIPSTNRERENEELARRIVEIHKRSRRTYGCPRILRALRQEGVRVGANRIRRIMLREGIFGRRPPRRWQRSSRASATPAPNILNRKFVAESPNQIWCGDITEYQVGSRRLYVAPVVDVFSRRVVGSAIGTDASSDLVVKAMLDAIRRRSPPPGLLFHSDQGAQYQSSRFRRLLGRHRIVQSMSRSGNCLDNAVAESFFATLEHELAGRTTWTEPDQARREILDFIFNFYNQERLHSTLGYMSPTTYEAAAAA